MSTTFQAICELHDEKGPRIHRSAGGAFLWPQPETTKFEEPNEVFRKVASAEWSVWLIQHEFCDFKMERYA